MIEVLAVLAFLLALPFLICIGIAIAAAFLLYALWVGHLAGRLFDKLFPSIDGDPVEHHPSTGSVRPRTVDYRPSSSGRPPAPLR